MKQNGTKFGLDQKADFKKSSELYGQIFWVLTNVGLNMNESERKESEGSLILRYWLFCLLPLLPPYDSKIFTFLKSLKCCTKILFTIIQYLEILLIFVESCQILFMAEKHQNILLNSPKITLNLVKYDLNYDGWLKKGLLWE